MNKAIVALAAIATPISPAPAGPVAMHVERPTWFTSHYGSGLDRAVQLVIRDQANWHQIWNRLNANGGPPRPLPRIDFSRRMLLVAALGQRPTGGYSIKIVSAVDRGSEVVATILRTSPGRRCGTIQAQTEPTDVVSIPASSKKVRWRFRDAVTPC